MRNFKIIISKLARQDLADTYRYMYYDLENPPAAEKFKNKFEEKARNLSAAPFLGEKHEKFSKYRVAHIPKYRIIYTVNEENQNVTIARIFYAGRDDLRERELHD